MAESQGRYMPEEFKALTDGNRAIRVHPVGADGEVMNPWDGGAKEDGGVLDDIVAALAKIAERPSAANASVTDTDPEELAAAPGAGKRIRVTKVKVELAENSTVTFKSATTVIAGPFSESFNGEIEFYCAENEALNAVFGGTGHTGVVLANVVTETV